MEATVYQYEKIITQYDWNTQTTTTNTVVVDQTTYNAIVPSKTSYTLPTGQVDRTISKNALSLYDYENNANEAKREIKLLNSKFVDQLETEFVKLMSK